MTATELLERLFRFDPKAPLLFTGGQFLLWFSLFLPAFLWLRKRRAARLAYLALFSCFFYYKCSGAFLLALLFTAFVDFRIALRIAESRDARARKLWLALSITLSAGILVYFKYTNFFVGSAVRLAGGHFEPFDIALPAGISFYTFESISYVVDVHKRRLAPARTFVEYAGYLAYFPHLMAGPIMRAQDLLPNLRATPELGSERVASGSFLVLCGLVKKAVVADYLARFSDGVFAGAAGLSSFEILLGVYAYAFQIFCDFSGYSDMAIGLSRILGVDLPENFRTPYAAVSITDFWRRWHITLSSWLRDYIYIPLGGNRHGNTRTCLHLLATMLLGGLWHGASMTFVLWGAAHGVLLCAEKLAERPLAALLASRGGRLAGAFVTFHVVAFLWIPFRSGNLGFAGDLLAKMVGDFEFSTVLPVLQARSTWLTVLALGAAFALVPSERVERIARGFFRVPLWARALASIAVIQLSLEVSSADVQPFIYFQF